MIQWCFIQGSTTPHDFLFPRQDRYTILNICGLSFVKTWRTHCAWNTFVCCVDFSDLVGIYSLQSVYVSDPVLVSNENCSEYNQVDMCAEDDGTANGGSERA